MSFVVTTIDEITINSENQMDRSPSFFHVNCLLTFYSVYSNSCFFKNINRAFYCNCSSVAPLLPEIFLWLAETRKKLNILSCILVLDLVLKFCSYINKGNGKHVLFYLFVLMKIAASVLGMSFFHPCFRF